VALVVVGASLLLGGLYIYRARQAEEATILLNNALDEFHGSVGSETAAEAGLPSFATAEEKYRTALASFQTVANDFGSYDEGRQARYYVGICHANLGDYEAARDALAEVRSGNRDLLYYLSSRALASVRAELGDHPGAAEIYSALIDDADNPLPKDQLLFELAKAEERAGNSEQALQVYERMLVEHPDSQLRGDAMTRKDALAYATGGGVGG
jgi:tetratricopeptide (TPR) repeat protein